jgi:A/G-specific adenine glycosylase
MPLLKSDALHHATPHPAKNGDVRPNWAPSDNATPDHAMLGQSILSTGSLKSQPSESFSQRILTWYDKNHRLFPWRIPPHDHRKVASPYLTWISEMMLQQTGASTVVPYFNRFIQAFPTVQALAMAPIDGVLVHWQGLGYYRRAHNLHKAARIMVDQGIPESYEEWLALPGIGPYTAAAITTIGQNQSAVAVDGNIRRVFSRYFGIDGPDWIKNVWKVAAEQLPQDRWGDYTQGLMDLGATLCQTRNPMCGQCPLVQQCHAFASGRPMDWPPKSRKIQKKALFGHIYVVFDSGHPDNGHVWMHEAPDEDLLRGLWRFPGSSWDDTLPVHNPSGCLVSAGTIGHLFTHIALTLHIWICPDASILREITFDNSLNGRWIPVAQIGQFPLSRLMQNVLEIARSNTSKSP